MSVLSSDRSILISNDGKFVCQKHTNSACLDRLDVVLCACSFMSLGVTLAFALEMIA